MQVPLSLGFLLYLKFYFFSFLGFQFSFVRASFISFTLSLKMGRLKPRLSGALGSNTSEMEVPLVCVGFRVHL
jgi:hypothetical protein